MDKAEGFRVKTSIRWEPESPNKLTYHSEFSETNSISTIINDILTIDTADLVKHHPGSVVERLTIIKRV